MPFECLLDLLTRLLLCGLLMPRTIAVQEQPPPPPANPGFAACSYSGACGETTSPTGLQALPVEKLPPECTSLFFDGLRVNESFTIVPARGDSDNVYIQNLGKSAKPFYAFYARYSYQKWMNYLGKDGPGRNPQEEIVRLTEYLKTVNIKGLVLKNLSLPLGDDPDPQLNDGLKAYIEAIKKNIPNLQIALFIPATHFIFYADCSKKLHTWLDFKLLNPLVDFYVMGFRTFNPCSNYYRIGGTIPQKGIPPFTLAHLRCAIKSSRIQKDKILFEFPSRPTCTNCKGTSCCDITYTTICTKPSLTSEWCADNSTTYRLKGEYAKKHGMGFMMTSVDRSDANNECLCQKPFSSFYNVLDGWLAAPPSLPCPRFDRTFVAAGRY